MDWVVEDHFATYDQEVRLEPGEDGTVGQPYEFPIGRPANQPHKRAPTSASSNHPRKLSVSDPCRGHSSYTGIIVNQLECVLPCLKAV